MITITKTDSNRCPVCWRTEKICIHSPAISNKTGFKRIFSSSENQRVFSQNHMPTSKVREFDNFIISTVNQFATNLPDRAFFGKDDKDLFKTYLGDFYSNLHDFGKQLALQDKKADFKWFYQPTLVDLFGDNNSTAGQTVQPKEEKISPSKISKPPHRMNSATNASRRTTTSVLGSFIDILDESNNSQSPLVIIIEDEPETEIQQPIIEGQTLNRIPPQFNRISPIPDSELADAFSTRSVRSVSEEKQLAQIEFKDVKYMARLSKSDLDDVKEFLIALMQECPVANSFTISEVQILNPKTKDFCVANKKALEIARDEWFGKDECCLIFKVDGIQKDQLPVSNLHIYH